MLYILKLTDKNFCIQLNMILLFAKNCISLFKPEYNATDKIMSKASLPKLDSLCILVAVGGKLQVLMDESLSKNSENI